MSLVNARAAFEKAITDAVIEADPRVKIIYDNVPFTSPGKTTTYVTTSITFTQSTLQAQGATLVLYKQMYMFLRIKVVQDYQQFLNQLLMV